MKREEKVARTFVELADTLGDDFAAADFLQQLTDRCRDILDVADAAVLLACPGQQLHVPAPCDPDPALSRLLELALREGPAFAAYSTGLSVVPGTIAHAPRGWAGFAARAREAGYTHACALPLSLRQKTIGSLLLLSTTRKPLPPEDLVLARSFAASATMGLLSARVLRESRTVNQQLRTALHSRIVIEQAKGFLAARRNTSLDHAFAAMRGFARSRQLRLSAVAQHVLASGILPERTPATAPVPATTPATSSTSSASSRRRRPL
ncbi:GAF and ANTAR domain-containing protein [Streptomyces sp. NPDC046925]|uniref:GAF and ANTAR domain-containing protein n=1 Tax=Streptomyces sp. NPDC046925 TaxID=3155375 RepID=UPI0033FACD12